MNITAALKAGYSRAYHVENGHFDLFVLVNPKADFDGAFKAWCSDTEELLTINGWQASSIEPETPLQALADETSRLIRAGDERPAYMHSWPCDIGL